MWTTIVAAVATSSTFVALSTFVLRRYFDHLLKIKAIEIEEKYKAQIAEQARRQSALFDEQAEVLKAANTLIYKARNTARIIRDAEGATERTENRMHLKSLDTYHQSFQELLFSARPILPQLIFLDLHDAKHALARFLHAVEEFRLARRRNREVTADIINDAYLPLDAKYESISKIVQLHLHQ